MALSEQIHIYSVDTSAFYTTKERKISDRMTRYRKYKRILSNANIADYTEEKLEKYNNIKSHVNREMKHSKDDLYKEFKNNKEIRALNEDYLSVNNVISIFDSALTRISNMKIDELYEDIIIVQTFFFDVIEDIIEHGFYCKGEKYVFLTASAGQIRTKKTVFIKESLWNKNCKSLMCGLTIEKINEKGGININKFLAYLALNNSATDVLEGFDIDKTIVVEDFETMVEGEVDLIDDETYTVERKRMPVPITHTDGCGMMLPSVSKKNFMVRLPWVKGLLVAFPFTKFIKDANKANPEKNHAIVKDIYGVEHDIIKEDIQIIFTKSQFKMYKYYESWQQYIEYFKEFNSQAGYCNLEEDRFKNARLNYQMLQTLTDITDEELTELASESVDRVRNIASDRETMLKAFGVTPYNKKKTPLQQALEIYPELLSDVYTKEVLKDIKKSMVKDYRSSKLEIDGKYTFIIPDLYAFCEWLFLGIENPKGLLNDGEVYCKLYKDVEKLDCLRSPHLYREHAVRTNVVDKEKGKWFITNGIYTSCHDLISKMLQFDCDGDRALVVANQLFVDIAERNMKGIVPLYYNMRKASDSPITRRRMYEGMASAYTGGNIGIYSNDISKIWNSGEVSEEQLKIIKLLCMENNFVIDYAKTLYKPTRPKEINKLITSYTKARVPHFFLYAKDKEEHQVEPVNNSVVNKLEGIIKDFRMKFTAGNLGKFDYRMLLSRQKVQMDDDLIKRYEMLNKTYHYKVNMQDSENCNIAYIAKEIREELSQFGYKDVDIANMLIKYLYDIKNSKAKESLWFCYGDIIVENLKKNIDNTTCLCDRCGDRYIKISNRTKYCTTCSKLIQKEQVKLNNKKRESKKAKKS